MVGAFHEGHDSLAQNWKSYAGSSYIFKMDGNGNWAQEDKVVPTGRSTNDEYGYSCAINGESLISGAPGRSSNKGAAFIFTRESTGQWNESASLTASDGSSNVFFAYDVAISGNYAVVGAPYEDHDSSGINYKSNAGSVYVFKKDGNGIWSQVSKLVASDRASDDEFGTSVDIHDSTVVIGAPEDGSSGSAYIFKVDNGVWTQEQKINTSSSGHFGDAVDLHNNKIVVGAPLYSVVIGINYTGSVGAAFLFTESGGVWSETDKLVANEQYAYAYMGRSVAIYDDDIVTGASYEDYDSLNGSFESSAGAVYSFGDGIIWDGTSWSGGSGTANAPNSTDGTKPLFINGSNGIISEDAQVNSLHVKLGADLTINANKGLTINNRVVNHGTLTVSNDAAFIQTHTGEDRNLTSGTFLIKRDGQGDSTKYNIWSSPINQGFIPTIFNANNPCDIYTFDPTTQSWLYDYLNGYSDTCAGNAVTFSSSYLIPSADGYLDACRGYFIAGSNTEATKTFSGTINNGSFSYSLTTTNLGNKPFWDDDDWNMVGNPYPSALNATEFWNTNSSLLSDGLYFWNEANDTVSAYNQHNEYSVWNLAGSVVPGYNNSATHLGHIASGQGFWVAASSAGTLQFTNSMRSGNNTQFFKTPPPINRNYWLGFTTPSGDGANILIGYNSITTDEIDNGYDAHKIDVGSTVSFASRRLDLISDEKFTIQMVGNVTQNETKMIPLSVSTDSLGEQTFTLFKDTNTKAFIDVFLYDSELDTLVDIENQNYTVDFVDSTHYEQRFFFVINHTGPVQGSISFNSGKDSTLTRIDDPDLNSGIVWLQDEIEIKAEIKTGFQGTLQCYDLAGKLIYTKIVGQSTQTVSWNWQSQPKGLYIISLLESGGHKHNHKAVK